MLGLLRGDMRISSEPFEQARPYCPWTYCHALAVTFTYVVRPGAVYVAEVVEGGAAAKTGRVAPGDILSKCSAGGLLHACACATRCLRQERSRRPGCSVACLTCSPCACHKHWTTRECVWVYGGTGGAGASPVLVAGATGNCGIGMCPSRCRANSVHPFLELHTGTHRLCSFPIHICPCARVSCACSYMCPGTWPQCSRTQGWQGGAVRGGGVRAAPIRQLGGHRVRLRGPGACTCRCMPYDAVQRGESPLCLASPLPRVRGVNLAAARDL